MKEVTLTDREIQVLQLIVADKRSAEIATSLDISIRTVETHRKNISRKAGARSPIALVKYAIKAGFVDGFLYKNEKK